MSDSQNKVNLTMVFDNQKALDKFVQFLDRFGEQVYWEWMQGADPKKLAGWDCRRQAPCRKHHSLPKQGVIRVG